MSGTPAQEDEVLVTKLYKISSALDTLQASKGPQEKKDELFKNILKIAGSKGNGFTKSKTLAAQLISRHVKDFPTLVDDSVNVLMDLCEEDELQVLIQAVKAFPAVCSQNLTQLPRVADVLGQLLQADVAQELDNVKQSLLALFRLDANGVMNTLTNQILTRNEDQREKAIEFILTPTMKEAIKDKIVSTQSLHSNFFENVKKILSFESISLSVEQISQFLELLRGLSFFQPSSPSYSSYVSQIVNTISTIAHLEKPLQKGDTESAEKRIAYIRTIIPFFNEQIQSNYVQLILSNVVPSFPELPDETKMRVLKVIAELSPYIAISEARTTIPSIYALFKQHTPVNSTKINFSFLECVLYSFHQLAYKAPGSLRNVCGIEQFTGQPSDSIPTDSDQNPKTLFDDFVNRLEFVKTNTSKYLKQLQESLQSNLEKEQRETLQSAYNLTKNIHIMVNSLLNKPNPIFLNHKSNKFNLSWKEPELGKRKQESTSDLNSEKQKKAKYNNTGSNRGNKSKQVTKQSEEFTETYTNRGGNFNRGRGFTNRGRGKSFQSRPRGRFY